jgi:hypothetical protein
VDRSPQLTTLAQPVEIGALSRLFRPSLEATWVLLCGAVASGAWRWESGSALRLLAAWLVADVALGYVFAQLRALKRASLAHAAQRRATAPPPERFVFPYASPGSPGARIAEHVNEFLALWRESRGPHAGHTGLAALAGVTVALVVAGYMGPQMLAATGGGLLLAALLAILAGRDEGFLARWLGGLHLTLAWALGHLALAPWRAPTLALGVLIGLGAYARTRLQAQSSILALSLLGLVWVSLVGVLLGARQPIPAMLVATAGLAERMASGAAGSDGSWVRAYPSRLGWLWSILLVALAVTYWA